MIRRIRIVPIHVVVAALLVCRVTGSSTAEAADYIWLEGENAASTNIEVQRSGWGNTQFLSGEKWLHCSIDAEKVDKQVPDDGVMREIPFPAPEGRNVPNLEPDRARIRPFAVRLADR